MIQASTLDTKVHLNMYSTSWDLLTESVGQLSAQGMLESSIDVLLQRT
jgi:phage terminase small subunit